MTASASRPALLTELARPPRWWWLPLLPLATLLTVHARWFWFVDDDAYISFVYARNFAEHNQLVFNLGERVEGYTNFLWTFGLGVLMKLGFRPEVAAPVLGIGFGIGTLVVVARLSARVRGKSTLWDWLPAALLAGSSGFACWCTGGLETQLFTFLVMLGVERAFADKYRSAALALGAAALTRPEGVLIVVLVSAHRILSNILGSERRWKPSRGELAFVVTFLAVYVPYFAWRYWYYGDLLPNTAYVKAGGHPSPTYLVQLHAQGAFYVWQWAWQSNALWAAPLAVMAAIWHRKFASLAWLIVGVYLLYAWRVGGDFMGLHRFVMPLFPLVAVLAGLGLASGVGFFTKAAPRAQLVVGGALSAILLVGFGISQLALSRASAKTCSERGIDCPGYLKQYADDREKIGRVLEPLMRPTDLSWVGGVGVQPYYGRMRAYDVFGLVSREVAHEVPPTRPRPGHQKWAPAQMVLKTDPTFIFYCYQLHPEEKKFQLCDEAGLFLSRGYEPCTIKVPGARHGAEYYSFLKKKDREFPCL